MVPLKLVPFPSELKFGSRYVYMDHILNLIKDLEHSDIGSAITSSKGIRFMKPLLLIQDAKLE